jgi:PRTRC genetic system protein A
MIDPRDRILQDLTPAVMVPRFAPCPTMEKSGHRYLVAADGLWLEVVRPWLLARVPLTPPAEDWLDGHHALPFGKLHRAICYNIDAAQFDAVRGRFLDDALRAMPNEYAAWGVYDARSHELSYQPLVAISASAGAISFHRPALDEHQHLAVDLHSHGALPPYFSPTDDEDDRGEVKAALVVGHLDQPQPGWASRLCLLGLFIASDDDAAHGDVPPEEFA